MGLSLRGLMRERNRQTFGGGREERKWSEKRVAWGLHGCDIEDLVIREVRGGSGLAMYCVSGPTLTFVAS